MKKIHLPKPTLAQVISAVVIVLTIAAVASQFGSRPKNIRALSSADFQAGRIIDDHIFTNKYAMSVGDIQNFLYAKVPACDTWGVKQNNHWNSAAGRYYTNGEWGALNGHYAPYTCLRDYKENPTTKQNNYSNPSAQIPGSKMAAEIIWDAAQKYNINPQVILTNLQKEQGLVTDDWPWSIQYRSAMGYGCPDTAQCNSQYYGFYNQVERATWQFRYYLDHPGAFNYWIGNNNIRYNPNVSCGSSNVYIQNAATAAVYIYTPYQPNAAALNGMSNTSPGGSGNCSAHGVRNFFWFFNVWFGSSRTSGYTWEFQSQGAYTDATKSTPANLGHVQGGGRYYLRIQVKNTGIGTWYKGKVNLATSQPIDRPSRFYDSTWPSWNRAATLQQDSVAPGESGSFEFWVTAPPEGGYFKEYFNLVAENASWMNDMGMHWEFYVEPRKYHYLYESNAVYTDATKTQLADLNNFDPEKRYYFSLKVKNDGNRVWYKNKVYLGTANHYDRTSSFKDSTWPTNNRTATTQEDAVYYGQTATFEFWMKMPVGFNGGAYREYFNLVDEGVAWMRDLGLQWTFHLNPNRYLWQWQGSNTYTDQTKTTTADPGNAAKDTRYYIRAQVRNVGNVTWYKHNVNLATSQPLNRASAFQDNTWLANNRAATLIEDSVAPGAVGTFEFWMKTPVTAGTYKEYFNLVAEYTAWMNDMGMHWQFVVQP